MQFKKILLSLFAWHLTFALFAQNPTVTGFHKRFVGTINKNIPIVLQLSRTGEELSGYYYYTKVGVPLRLAGKLKPNGWKISEYANGETQTGTFDGNLVGGKIVGIWKTAKGDKQYDFELKEDYSSGAMAFDNFHMEGTLRLFKEHEMPSANMKIDANFPQNFENQAVLKKIQDAMIEKLEPVGGRVDIAGAMRQSIKNYLEAYKKDMENATIEDAVGDMSYQYSYNAEKSIKVAFNDHYVLSLLVWNYEFTGGAHGNTNAEYLVFDLKTGNLVTTKDLFQANANVRTKLEALINEQFRKDQNIPAKTSLTEFGMSADKIPIPENFFVTQEGIVFFYNVYEIAAYAMGQFEVMIPFAKLKPLLKPDQPLKNLIK